MLWHTPPGLRKKAIHQKPIRRTPEALWALNAKVSLQPSDLYLSAFKHLLWAEPWAGLGAGDERATRLQLEGLTVQERSSQEATPGLSHLSTVLR